MKHKNKIKQKQPCFFTACLSDNVPSFVMSVSIAATTTVQPILESLRGENIRVTSTLICSSTRGRPVCKGGGVTRVVTPLNLSEVKFSESIFGSCTTVTAQFSSFVHQCGCSQL